jgi:adenylylsulfate kinase-like enzyme
MKQKGLTLWFTGLSGSGKTTITCIVEKELCHRGCRVERLDGDLVRTHLTNDLGFSKEDRHTNIRRVAYVADLKTRRDRVGILHFAIPRDADVLSANDPLLCRGICSLFAGGMHPTGCKGIVCQSIARGDPAVYGD